MRTWDAGWFADAGVIELSPGYTGAREQVIEKPPASSLT
jgi:hypothetical protein